MARRNGISKQVMNAKKQPLELGSEEDDGNTPGAGRGGEGKGRGCPGKRVKQKCCGGRSECFVSQS